MNVALSRRVAAEFLGTAFLVAAVVGSGIMGERLAGGNIAIALLANTIATGAALVALILAFGAISGAHLNPAVTMADSMEGGLPWAEVPAYIFAQIIGDRRSDDGARDVWAFAGFAIEPQPQRTGTSVQRIRCNIWIAVCDLGLLPASFGFGSIRGGCVHHLSVLVHGIYLFRESGRYDCAVSKRHVFGYPADGCSVVCAGATGRGICSDDGFSVARPTASGGGGVIQRVTSHCSGGTGASRENYLRGQRNFACEMFGRIPSWVASWRGAYWAACWVRCAIAARSSDSV